MYLDTRAKYSITYLDALLIQYLVFRHYLVPKHCLLLVSIYIILYLDTYRGLTLKAVLILSSTKIGCVIVKITFRYANMKLRCDSTQNDANTFFIHYASIASTFVLGKMYSEKRICVDEQAYC